MPESSIVASEEAAPAAPALPAPEPIRVLMPSVLGQLGIEIVGSAVSRVLIAPPAKHRKLFIPLIKMKRSEAADEIFGRLSEYLAGVRRNLDIDADLGPSGCDAFAQQVLRETMNVPYGRTRTYQYIAEAAGKPEAYRQVLAILQENPIPLVIPCHRIVTHRSGIGSWIGGTRKKQWLLRLEEQTAASG